MTPEIVAPAVLIVIAVVVVVQTQLLSPILTRRRFAEEMVRRGWMERAEGDSSFDDIMTLAIEENQGEETVREYDEKIGPFLVHSRFSTWRTGRALRIYCDPETNRHRCAAVGKKIERHESRSSPFPFSRWKRYSHTLPEIWFGEARRLPVRGPEVAFNWFTAEFGIPARKLAIKGDVEPATIPAIAPPAESSPAQAIREIIRERSSLAISLKAKVYISPRAWVMCVPLNHVRKRSGDILDLGLKISDAVDRVSRFTRPGEELE